VQESPSPKGSLNLSGLGNFAAIMGFESPLKSSRSVVFLHADKAADLRKISDALVDPEQAASIQGDFAVVDDKNVNHTKVSPTYYLGSLPSLSKVRWFFSDQPLLLGLIGLLAGLLAAAIVYRAVRRIGVKRSKKIS
jgi:hypothetical protein